MTPAPSIRSLEEFTLTAWPAPGQVLLDGWVARFAGGYTRRANSVHPLYPGETDLATKVASIEKLYGRAGLPTIFKLTSASEPPALADYLISRGYRADLGAMVQSCDLKTANLPAPAAAEFVRTWNAPAEEWVEAFTTFNAIPPRHLDPMLSILNAIVPARRFVALVDYGQIIACGLGVLEPPFVGLFDIVTRPDQRRRGAGRQLCGEILRWGRDHGATVGCLQVMTTNTAGMKLYAGLGFADAYEYRYYVKERVAAGV